MQAFNKEHIKFLRCFDGTVVNSSFKRYVLKCSFYMTQNVSKTNKNTSCMDCFKATFLNYADQRKL